MGKPNFQLFLSVQSKIASVAHSPKYNPNDFYYGVKNSIYQAIRETAIQNNQKWNQQAALETANIVALYSKQEKEIVEYIKGKSTPLPVFILNKMIPVWIRKKPLITYNSSQIESALDELGITSLEARQYILINYFNKTKYEIPVNANEKKLSEVTILKGAKERQENINSRFRTGARSYVNPIGQNAHDRKARIKAQWLRNTKEYQLRKAQYEADMEKTDDPNAPIKEKLQAYQSVKLDANRQEELDAAKIKLDQANLKFLEKHNQRANNFVSRHQNKANTLFGVFASSNTTAMVAQEILLKKLPLSLSATSPIGILILWTILFNVILDRFLFDHIEKSTKKHISIKQREGIKFLFICIVVAFLIGFGYYVIPIILILFTASYFINYALQMGKLKETIKKLFFTLDKEGIPRFLEGFRKDGDIELSSRHILFLKVGFATSMVYAVVVGAIFAKWVFPLIAGAVFLGSMASPIGILVCAALVIYGLIYAMLAMRGWADLAQLDVWLKNTYGAGIFSWAAVKHFGRKLASGLSTYWQEVGASGLQFFQNLHMLFSFSSNRAERFDALLNCLSGIGGFFAEIGIVLLKIVQIAFSILVPYGMFNLLESGGEEIGKFIHSNKTGQALALGTCVANTPLIVKSVATVVLPEEKKEIPTGFARLMMTLYYMMNFSASGLLSTDGKLPVTSNENKLEIHPWRMMAMCSSSAISSAITINSLVNVAKKDHESDAEIAARSSYKTWFNQWNSKISEGIGAHTLLYGRVSKRSWSQSLPSTFK